MVRCPGKVETEWGKWRGWQKLTASKAHLLIDVDSLLVLLQLCCVASYLQQTLVG